jgi:DNA-binding transcriptional ArsR family regulator
MRTAGDENRLKILCIIFGKKNVCVSDIAKELSLSIAVVSHHLQVMFREGLVLPVRQGKRICYELPREPFIADLKKFVCKYK